MNISVRKPTLWLGILWVSLSIFMLYANHMFYINDFFNIPQHERFEFMKQAEESIKSSPLWYHTFFIADAIWAPTLLVALGLLLTDAKGVSLIKFWKSKQLASKGYSIIAVLAILTDWTEGVMYWHHLSGAIETIVILKYTFYVLITIFFLYWLLRDVFTKYYRSIFRFLITSLLSLILISILYGLLTLMPQGGTIVVDLFFSPINTVLLFILVGFLAILISHYPVYFDIWLFGDNQSVQLKKDRTLSFLGWSIIYYDSQKAGSGYIDYNDNVVKILRRSLGIFLITAVFSVIVEVAFRVYDIHISSLYVTLLFLLLSITFQLIEGKRYLSWKRALRSDNKQSRERAITEIYKYVNRFTIILVSNVFVLLIIYFVSFYNDWGQISILTVLMALGLQMTTFIQFRISRSYFKYVFFTTRLFADQPSMFEESILKDFVKSKSEKEVKGIKRWFGYLSNNIVYLKLMRIVGAISLSLFLVASCSFEIATHINPINVILLYSTIVYSLITIIFKHILYYHRLEHEPQSIREKNLIHTFRYGIILFAISVIGLATYTSIKGNDLHALKKIKSSRNDVPSYSDFVENLLDNEDRENNVFFIGSYGGGLKANLWNLILLNELHNKTPKLFSRTIAMSGVSGGAVGIGNFSALLKEKYQLERLGSNSFSMIDQIKLIGKSNVLSNELIYLLGRDWIREYFPWQKGDTDRAHKSMNHHAENTKMDSFNMISFQDYWMSLYELRSPHYPALIMNSTRVGGRHGVASTIDFPQEAFPGAIRTSMFEEKDISLTYYGAISTTNRFPIFSPAAKIEGKGGFLDGGYFENSGMLSLLNLYDYLESTKTFSDRINPIFINIINSKDNFIRSKILEWDPKLKTLDESKEISSIINTTVSIDKLPDFVNRKIVAQGHVLETIVMPHIITYEDVLKFLNGDVEDPILLMTQIKRNNDSIMVALKEYQYYKYEKWGIVEPPLARLLSEPAVEYQFAMVQEHSEVKRALERVGVYLNCTKVVTQKTQKSIINRQNIRE